MQLSCASQIGKGITFGSHIPAVKFRSFAAYAIKLRALQMRRLDVASSLGKKSLSCCSNVAPGGSKFLFPALFISLHFSI